MDGNKKIKSLLVLVALFLIYSCQVKMPISVQFFETTSVVDNVTDTILNDEYYKTNQTDLIVYNKIPTDSITNNTLPTNTNILSPIADRNSYNEQITKTTDTIFNTNYITDTSNFINYSRYKPKDEYLINQENIDSELYLDILNSLDSIQNLLNHIASKETTQYIEENTFLVNNAKPPENTNKLPDNSYLNNLLKIKSDSINYLSQKIQLYENIDDTSKFKFLLPKLRNLQDSMYNNLLTQKSDSILVLQNKINQNSTYSNYNSFKLQQEKDSLISHSNKQNILINTYDSIQERALNIKSDSIKLLQKQITYYRKLINNSDNSQNNKIGNEFENNISDTNKNLINASNLTTDSAAHNDIPIIKLKYDTIYKYIDKYDTLSFVGYYKPNSLNPTNIIDINEKISNIDSSLVTSIIIAAYTDISGSTSINYELSNRRLLEFENILLNIFSFDRKIIYKQAFGSIYSTSPQNEKERKIVIKFIISDKIN